MTARELYRNELIECVKEEAPTLLLDDFLYLANKAVQKYANRKYNSFEMNQQLTDDLGTLRITCNLPLNQTEAEGLPFPREDASWFCTLPNDYFHLLNCVVKFERVSPANNSKCKNGDGKDVIYSAAKKLTSNLYPAIISNSYLKPSYKVPYYFITTLRVSKDPNSELEKLLEPCNISSELYVDGLESILNPCFDGDNLEFDNVNRMEIRCGRNNLYIPTMVYVDYLRKPQQIVLTQEELDMIEDTSMELEFPEYVCYEIVNELTTMVLENSMDPRLQTNVPINQTIATPGVQVKQQ